MELIIHLFVLSLATGACAITVSKMKVARPLHELAARANQQWLQDLLTCPYCLAFWFSAFWVMLTTGTGGGWAYLAALWAATAGGGAILGGVMFRVMFLHERELDGVRSNLKATRERMEKAESALTAAQRKIDTMRSDAQAAKNALWPTPAPMPAPVPAPYRSPYPAVQQEPAAEPAPWNKPPA